MLLSGPPLAASVGVEVRGRRQEAGRNAEKEDVRVCCCSNLCHICEIKPSSLSLWREGKKKQLNKADVSPVSVFAADSLANVDRQ